MTSGSNSQNSEPVDKAGESILRLLQKAADAADQNGRQAVEMAHKLSHQLRAAHDRIAELESNIAANRDRAERAEAWLHKIRGEIEEQFTQRGPKPPP